MESKYDSQGGLWVQIVWWLMEVETFMPVRDILQEEYRHGKLEEEVDKRNHI